MATATKPVEKLAPPIMIPRLRCSHGKDAWMAGLYVVWAPVPAQPNAKSTYLLWKTNDRGYLSPLQSGDANTQDSHKLFPGVPYDLYLVLHPQEKVAREILDKANQGNYEPDFRLRVSPRIEATGKSKGKGKGVDELILEIPEGSAKFLPKGSVFYGGLTLYESMPIANCPAVKWQIEKLQIHLGLLRYVVGNGEPPYAPSVKVRPNAGKFDALTYNAVLRFQRDAKDGKFFQIDNAVQELFFDRDKNFDAKPAAKDAKIAAKESPRFLDGSETTSSSGFQAKDEGVVDADTGKEIAAWLQNHRRKSGHILIGWSYDRWLREEAHKALVRWDAALRKLGYKRGIEMAHTFRDARAEVSKAGAGRVALSIHKSGLAIDLETHGFRGWTDKGHIVYQQELVSAGVAWRLYAYSGMGSEEFDAAAAQCDPPLKNVYCSRVTPWCYDPANPDGGTCNPPMEGTFIDVTAVAAQVGLFPIHAHKSGWQATIERRMIELKTPPDFKRFAEELSQLKKAGNGGQYVYISDDYSYVSVKVDDLDPDYLQDWATHLAAGNPLPDVSISDGADFSQHFNGRKIVIGDGSPIEVSPALHLPPGAVVRPYVGAVTPKAGDRVVLPNVVAKGDPVHQEWWHFQYQGEMTDPNAGPPVKGKRRRNRKWSDLMMELGWTKEGLKKVGYSEKQFEAEAH